jgi:hypothetical protein
MADFEKRFASTATLLHQAMETKSEGKRFSSSASDVDTIRAFSRFGALAMRTDTIRKSNQEVRLVPR